MANNLESIKVNNSSNIYVEPLSNIFFRYPTYMYRLYSQPNQDGHNIFNNAKDLTLDYRCIKISFDVLTGSCLFYYMANYNPATGLDFYILNTINCSLGYSYRNTLTYDYMLSIRTDSRQTTFWPLFSLTSANTIVRINDVNYCMGRLIEGLTINNTQASLPYFDKYNFRDTIATSELTAGYYIISSGTCNVNGYLNHVMFFRKTPNTNWKLFVGFVDLRNIFVTRYEISVNGSYFQNNYYWLFLKDKYDIREYETVCIYDSENFLEITDVDASLKHSRYTTNLNNPLSDGGFYSPIEFSVHPVNGSNLDIATEIEKINDNISDLYNRNATTTDENGVKYEIVVRGGEVVPISNVYSKCLCLGNSLTSHGYAPNIGYYGDEPWAMASTNKVETTWSNLFEKVLKQKNASASCKPFNIYNWETNYINCDFDDIFSEITDNYDLIIMRAGENGTAGSDYEQGTDRLIQYLKTRWPDAVIVMSDMFWHNQTKETAMKNTATKFGLQYISFGNIADSCELGQMLMGRDDVLHPVIHSGVKGHCTDVCFFDYANILANSLNYSLIIGKYTVNVSTSSQYKINNSYQIHNGYVTILTYGSQPSSMTVRDSSQTVIDVQHISLSNVLWQTTPSPLPTFASVFKMPNSNVIVTF